MNAICCCVTTLLGVQSSCLPILLEMTEYGKHDMLNCLDMEELVLTRFSSLVFQKKQETKCGILGWDGRTLSVKVSPHSTMQCPLTSCHADSSSSLGLGPPVPPRHFVPQSNSHKVTNSNVLQTEFHHYVCSKTNTSTAVPLCSWSKETFLLLFLGPKLSSVFPERLKEHHRCHRTGDSPPPPFMIIGCLFDQN